MVTKKVLKVSLLALTLSGVALELLIPQKVASTNLEGKVPANENKPPEIVPNRLVVVNGNEIRVYKDGELVSKKVTYEYPTPLKKGVPRVDSVKQKFNQGPQQ